MACAYVQVHSSQAVHTTSRVGNICSRIQQTKDLSSKADVPFRKHSKENLSSKTWLERDTARRTFSAVLSPQKRMDSMYHFFEPY
jgi:hypothetical protein